MPPFAEFFLCCCLSVHTLLYFYWSQVLCIWQAMRTYHTPNTDGVGTGVGAKTPCLRGETLTHPSQACLCIVIVGPSPNAPVIIPKALMMCLKGAEVLYPSDFYPGPMCPQLFRIILLLSTFYGLPDNKASFHQDWFCNLASGFKLN